MKSFRWTFEGTFYLLAFSLALFVRLLQLGAVPLSDFEANWAIQALALARGQSFNMGPQPLYVVLTGLIFYIFGSSGFLARLIPALAGSLLVILPFAFRRSLGKKVALIVAFGLALDPGLVALSRLAGGPMLAASMGLFTLTALYYRRFALAGILAGLTLLSGPEILTGLLGLLLAFLAIRSLETMGYLLPFGENGHATIEIPPASYRTILFFLLGVFFLVGTLFLNAPEALGAAAATIPAYLSGWVTPSDVPALRLPAALLVYQPLATLFGLIGLVRAWTSIDIHSNPAKRLSLWFLFALLVGMIYPARQLDNLVWALIPLWGLAALELDHDLVLLGDRQARLASIGQAILLFTLFAYAWENIAGLDQLATANFTRTAIFLILGALALATVTTILVALGWSWSTARSGLTWGVGVALGLYMLSAIGAAAQNRAGATAVTSDLWAHPPAAGQARLLSQTIHDLDIWNKGQGDDLKIVSLVDEPSIHWLLRNWPDTSFQTSLVPGNQPDLILSYKEQETPSLTASYRGQDFAWQITPTWQGILPPDLPRWVAFRQADQTDRLLILWARGDLFPGGTTASQPANQP
jgi:hypothetical protein